MNPKNQSYEILKNLGNPNSSYLSKKAYICKKNSDMDKITIHYGIQGNGLSFGLIQRDYKAIKQNFPQAQPSKGVFIEYDMRSNFKDYRPQLERYVFPALVGMFNEADLKQFRRIEFVKTPQMEVTYVIDQNTDEQKK